MRNTDVLPLDAQTWSILAVPELLDRRLTSIDCIDTHHVTQHSGFTGVDFNSDKDGVWFEGTGQFAVALAMANPVDFRRVNVFRKELARAAGQVDADGIMGMVAATKDFLTTGFVLPSGQQFSYFRRLHIAAESWNVFAQVGFNPYYQTVIRTPGDATQDAVVSFSDFLVLAEEYGKTVDPTANTADFNGDLRVSFADFLILASNYGLGT